MRGRVFEVGTVLGLAALYVVAARLGLAFGAVSGFATFVWPPTGIALAAVLLLGPRVWPGILLGAVTTNLLIGAPVAVALGIGVGNTLEALVGAHLLRRVPGFGVTLERATSVLGLIILAALFATLVSATIGVASLYAGHIVSTAGLGRTFRAWWIGDMVGAIVVGPIILVWSNRPSARFRHRRVERVVLGAAVVVVALLTFFSSASVLPVLSTPLHPTTLLFALLIWAALRFGPRGASSAAFTISVAAAAGTALGHGPFAHADLQYGLLSLQTFMAVTTATVLVLGATTAERRIASEEAQRALDEAARANRVKSEFLAVMSHELRTPLNAIAGYAELLETGVYGSLDDKQREAVSRIHQNEQGLLTLIDEILGFARAERGEVRVKSEPVQVADAFDSLEPMLRPSIERKRFVLKRDLARPRLAVQADPDSLRQILVSLVSNASKYTGEGGQITLGADREGAKVRIWVSDTGAGIAPDQIENVFEPFFQSDHGRTRRSTGVGLGLTIARDLARRMSGEVTIASRVGRGTTASVVLPAA